jgi:hypothetical protein
MQILMIVDAPVVPPGVTVVKALPGEEWERLLRKVKSPPRAESLERVKIPRRKKNLPSLNVETGERDLSPSKRALSYLLV